jgi:hypothetical protein
MILSAENKAKFVAERALGDASINFGKQVKNLEASGTFQRLANESVEFTARGLAAKLVSEENKTSEANVWVSLAQLKG